MALKGTATIELTNADGSKETIKHDNMITNAVNDLCLSQRGEMAAILKMVNQNDSYAQAMFGGLLLFGDTLNDNPDDYEIPTTNIVGYASQDAYAGLDVARGSFNQSEGGVQEDGSYKFVWDFATSQANGTIKSLALCPNIMGRIGASDTIVNSERSDFKFVKEPQAPFNSYGRMLSDSGSIDGSPHWAYNIVAIIGDIAYAVDYYNIYNDGSQNSGKYRSRCVNENGGILKLYKFRLGSDSISLADRVAMARYIECINIQLPAEITSVLSTRTLEYIISFYYNQRDKKLIVFPITFTVTGINKNETVPYIDIDLQNNMHITKHTFTNTTEGGIETTAIASVSDYDAAYCYCVIADYIIAIAHNDGARVYIIDKNDNVNVKKATFANGNELVPDNNYFVPLIVNKDTIIISFKGQKTSLCNNVYIVDLNTGIAKKTNVSGNTPLTSKANVDFGNKVIKIRTGTYLTYYVTINPFVLTTKNNLDAPVVKTASQTMKITYTLSEVAESGV